MIDAHHQSGVPPIVLPVIDEIASLEQCGDWMFIVELLLDILTEGHAALTALRAAWIFGDHSGFWRTAHAIKGSALNLHLPALTAVSQRAEELGRRLEMGGGDDQQHDFQEASIKAMEWELDRLRRYFPTAQARAREQLQASEWTDRERLSTGVGRKGP